MRDEYPVTRSTVLAESMGRSPAGTTGSASFWTHG